MGNEISAEEESDFLDEAYNGQGVPERLDRSDVNEKVNVGTSAPNCQPKHTRKEHEQHQVELQRLHDGNHQEGLEVAMSENSVKPEMMDQGGKTQPMSSKQMRRTSSVNSDDERNKTDNTEKQKKMSYIQMAKLGYQELVNAIVRPPRADYKVRSPLSYFSPMEAF